MWGFIIKRVIASADRGEKDRTAAAVPVTQQLGFALSAALAGVIANSLGMAADADTRLIEQIAFWLFAGFLPIALMGCVAGWKFTSATASKY